MGKVRARAVARTRARAGARIVPLWGVFFLAVAACTSTSSIIMDREQVAAALLERGISPSSVVYPNGLNDEMRAWAHRATAGSQSAEEELAKLQQHLLDPNEISVHYEWGYTGTAEEVFQNKRANCLAFTNLFVGMARELGLEVYYLGVEDVESYRKEGDLVVVSDHIAVGYGSLGERRIYDFSENPPDDYRNFTKIPDLTAIAMFHSNRGAESLQRGEVGDAILWLRTAVRVDPELPNAWVNLGVALRRQGDHEAAEEAYRKALNIDPRTYSAYQNLASLLRIEGRREEARAYEHMLAGSPSRNPYTYLALGDLSLMGGRVEEAEKLYRRAIRLNDKDADAYAALGHLAAGRGDLRYARKMLRKAQKVEGAGEYPRLRRLEEFFETRGGR